MKKNMVLPAFILMVLMSCKSDSDKNPITLTFVTDSREINLNMSEEDKERSHIFGVEIENNLDSSIYIQTFDSLIGFGYAIKYTKRNWEGNHGHDGPFGKTTKIAQGEVKKLYFFYVEDQELADSLCLNFIYSTDSLGKNTRLIKMLYSFPLLEE